MKGVTELPTVVQLFEQGVQRSLHTGMQVYVSLRSRTVADFALGQASPGQPMTPDHLMVWFSSGKPITAIAIAQLVDQGRLELDAPVARYIPAFAQQGKEAITLRHVLTHTGGFRAAPFRFPRDDWGTILDRICSARLEPNWTPGQKAGYHPSTGWFILGELIQRVSGQPVGDYLREHVLEPAGMVDSWVGMPANRYEAYGQRIAPMMDATRQPPAPSDRTAAAYLVPPSPGSNAYGPIRQLGRFYEMLLAGGRWEGRQILSEQRVQQWTSPQRVGLYDHTFKYPVDWGLGFIIQSQQNSPEPMPYGFGPHASRRAFGHAGMQSSVGLADPAHGLAVAIAFNGMPGEMRHQRRMHAILAALYEDLGLAQPTSSSAALQ